MPILSWSVRIERGIVFVKKHKQAGVVSATSPSPDGTLDRRRLLRAGGLLAGAAGLGAAALAGAPAAAAATGDPVIAGGTTDAGSATSAVTAAASTATLRLSNTSSGAQLNLQPVAAGATPTVTAGDLVNVAGDLWFDHGSRGSGSVYTSVSANQLLPITPQRAADTRTASGRTRLVNRVGNVDSSGRALAGHTLELDLSDLVFEGTAVYLNLTVVGPAGSGFLTVWPSGARPNTSSLNYLANQVIANFAVTALSTADTVLLQSTALTHLVVDVVGFVAGDWSHVNPTIHPAAAALAQLAVAPPAARRTAPDWFAAHA